MLAKKGSKIDDSRRRQ